MENKIIRILQDQTEFFNSQQTKEIKFRLRQLKKFKEAILQFEDRIYDALYKDLHKSKVEAYASEIGLCLKEISYFQRNLKKWAKPQRVKSPLLFPLSTSRIYSEPFGKVLIISPWNYPFGLSITPLIAAIAAGNTIILKPSRISAHTSQVMLEMIESAFESNYIHVIKANAENSRDVLKFKFDYIFFTGSEKVGKIVMQAAAENLTPVTLEMGGKSPCLVDRNCNLEKTARRIVYGKFLNCGQTCISPDYLFVHQEIKDKLIENIKTKIEEFYGNDPQKSPDYGRIIRKEHFEKLLRLTKDTKVILGGKNNIDELYFEPTLIECDETSPIMQEEIFGPILPVFTFTDKKEVIDFINNRPKPLALYVFSNDKKFRNEILNQTSSGAVCVNDTVLHFANENLPFGGVGSSGMGSYHGRKSFETFSHQKSVMRNTNLFEIPKRYPPADESTLKILKWLVK
ncbi:MAG: aldehyde dehydrogenase [Candidatus Cloacimonadales bacterium]|nr:aldehyde dehydrogenase [Candidatus Cloacimonadales bacterium]